MTLLGSEVRDQDCSSASGLPGGRVNPQARWSAGAGGAKHDFIITLASHDLSSWNACLIGEEAKIVEVDRML